MMKDEHTDTLLAAARNLPERIEPPQDLWPDIEERMQMPVTRAGGLSRIFPLATAATLVLGLVMTAGYFAARMFPRQSLAPESLVTAPSAPADARFGIHYAMGPGFVQTRRDLISDLDTELSNLSPDSRRVVVQNLANIDRAIQEINQALEQEPNNVLLQKLLFATYSEELQLLGEMDGLTRTLHQRTRI